MAINVSKSFFGQVPYFIGCQPFWILLKRLWTWDLSVKRYATFKIDLEKSGILNVQKPLLDKSMAAILDLIPMVWN